MLRRDFLGSIAGAVALLFANRPKRGEWTTFKNFHFRPSENKPRDDTGFIQGWIDSYTRSGGSHVPLPAGDFQVRTLHVPRGCTIQGHPAGTIFRPLTESGIFLVGRL
jgi:hypothetical protein